MNKHTISKNSVSLSSFLLILLLMVAGLVSNRDISLSADSLNYEYYFSSLSFSGGDFSFEPGFHYFSLFLKLIEANSTVYFFFIYVTFNAFYFLFYKLACDKFQLADLILGSYALVGFLFASSWYFVATTNGLRQGLALPFLYISLLFFKKKSIFIFLFFYFISISFHYSSALVAPFLIMLLCKHNRIFISLFLVSATSYFFGILEPIVLALSNAMGLDFYQKIKEYGADSGNWIGFDIFLFLYSIFWLLFFYFCRRFVSWTLRSEYDALWRSYGVLLMPYFFFGFGGYANRYAFIGWLLIPALQAYLLASARIDNFSKRILVGVVFVFGICSYSYNVINFYY